MTQRILPIDTTHLRLQVLSPDDVKQIHQATLDLIETIGVRFPSERALDILGDHGATIDREAQIARIPGHVVEEAMSQAPAKYTLCARENRDLDLPLDGGHAYLAVDGTGVEVLDPYTGEKRVSTKGDVADSMRVADYVEEIALIWPPVSAQDCPKETRGLHELEAVWNNYAKHAQTETLVTAHEMKAAVEMAAAIVGGRDQLRQRPILSTMQCTMSPLAHDGGSLESALVAAEAGLPVAFMTTGGPGRQSDRGQRRGHIGAGHVADGTSRLPRLLRGGADGHGPAHRGLYRRRPGGLSLWRGHQPPGRLL
jgi:trimethylamine--corrinoid protein Co-methyltransferase